VGHEDDAYFCRRAEAERRQAQRATSLEAVRVHIKLADLCLAKTGAKSEETIRASLANEQARHFTSDNSNRARARSVLTPYLRN
jgi:hypothetical protein